MKNPVRALLFLICSTIALHADWKSIGNVTGVQTLPDGVELAASAPGTMDATSARVRITALNDSTVRVRVAPNGAFPKDISWAVDPAFKPQAPAVHVNDAGNEVTLDLTAAHVRVMKNPLRIQFLDQQGKVINEDAEAMMFNGAEFRVTKGMPFDDSEHYYGLGDKTSLVLNHRAFALWNTDQFGWQESWDPLYKDIPFFTAMRNGNAYGIFLDNPYRSHFDFGVARHDEYSFGAEGGELNYYFFFGPEPKQVLTAYTNLTGKAPMPPLWAFGYQQSRYSYYPEARAREIAKTFRDHKIPADVLYFDIDYQDHYRPFTINRENFPHFEGMVKDLKQEGFSTVLITDLHIAKLGYAPYDSGAQQDVFIKKADGTEFVGPVWPGPAVFPDFTLSRVRDWWGSLYKDFVGMGVRGFWNDMNEPSVFQTPTKTMPLDVVHRLDDGSTMPHLGAHNILGMENSRGTYEGLLKLQPNERPFVLTRATYAGGQRFSATWTGDNSGTWNHMRMSLPTLLNLGISGMPMVGDDIGGFNGTAPADLVTRWMWLGVFNPIYRNHSAMGTGNKEPWAFGPQYERMMKAAIEQRYRLLPYIYTAAEEASHSGMPIMRPMFLEFPKEDWLATNETEFMFGPSMLVAPRVIEFNEPYQVSLPVGIWYNYWTGETYNSQAKAIPSDTAVPHSEALSVKVDPKVNEIPVYVRGGSIIPHQPVVQSTAYTPQGNLELRVYPGADCKSLLYLDDGHTPTIDMNNHLDLPMSCNTDVNSASLKLENQRGKFKPWFSNLDVVFYGAKAPAKSASLNGQPLPAPKYDATHHTVTVTAPYNNQGETITVNY
jgi:alpha-glucosidase